MIDWHELTPGEVLDNIECLSFEQAAYVLNLTYLRGTHKGEPNPTAVRDLVAAGKLRILDPDQKKAHQRITAAGVRHYRDTGLAMPRRQLDIGAA
jgi:hypothetical protein